MSLTVLPVLETLVFLLGCFVQPGREDFCFVLLYLVLNYLKIDSWSLALFCRGNKLGVDLGERGG